MQLSRKPTLFAVTAFVLALGLAPLAKAEGAGQYISDAAITAKVKASIMSNAALKATDVSVETTQGVVQLTGSVNSADQEKEAVNTAKKVSGVQSVKDLLSVGTPQPE